MSRFLDWLDESAAGLIRVAYLLAGVIAVASYFSDGNVPHQFSDFLNTILPWALAGALEIHTYLTARRVRQAWQDWSAAALGSDEHERAGAQMKLNLWILGALLAFSMYNQLQYLAATWTPPHTPLTPPGPWAYIIRAIITPAAFMAAAFLAPVGEGLALQVQSQAHRLALATFKVATQQWKRRLRQMQQAGQDVTGALVQLVDDPAERRVIEAIWQAMQHPGELPTPTSATATTTATTTTSEQSAAGVVYARPMGVNAPALPPIPTANVSAIAADGAGTTPSVTPPAQHMAHVLEATAGLPTATQEGADAALLAQPDASSGESGAPKTPDDDPPSDGNRSAAVASRETHKSNSKTRSNVTPITRRGLGRAPRAPKRVTSRANARSGYRGNAEARVRAALAAQPTLTDQEVMITADVSSSTVSKYRRLIEAENRAATAQSAQQA